MADFESLLDSLARIQRAGRPLFAQDPAGGARVSAHQGRILAFLDDADPVMVGELADHLGVTASTMSLTLGRLEHAGYIRRDRDPADRRVANVRLTEGGVRARDARRELDPHRLGRMLSLLDPTERREALRALALLAGAADRLLRLEREDVSAQV
ncbi:MAG: MarR family winged helix-turn-helix transcriptional regulator [Longimicrobiales bacterium]|nr:MarR family winged helix-turn-helix transcriptional regulator [Longimicrobiales bacterium]